MKKYDLSSIKIAGSGAAPLSADVIKEFKNRVKVENLPQGNIYHQTKVSRLVAGHICVKCRGYLFEKILCKAI